MLIKIENISEYIKCYNIIHTNNYRIKNIQRPFLYEYPVVIYIDNATKYFQWTLYWSNGIHNYELINFKNFMRYCKLKRLENKEI